jgi:hypothetical protein
MRLLLSGLASLLLAGVSAMPASAAPAEPTSTSPAAYCRSVYQPLTNPVTGITFDQYVIQVRFNFGGQTVVEPFGLGSFSACVSTVASAMDADGTVPGDSLTKPAYLAQCTFLERVGAISYPYKFYGVYPAKNRADCARILKGVHTGQLELPGEPPVG